MMKKTLIMSAVLLSILQKSYAQVQSKSFKVLLDTMLSKSVPTVSCGELKKMNGVVLLDAREKREYEVSHIQNARWIGYETFSFSSLKDIPKDASIVVYCSIGVRSEKIGEKLQQAGYKHVKNLYGSIFEWVNQGNAVYDMNGKATNKIHAYSRTWGVWCNKGEKVYE